MEPEAVAKFHEVLENAKFNGWDERRAFGEFRACLTSWLTGSPFYLGGMTLRVICEMLLNPREGPLQGGYGFEHLDFREFNRVRDRLFEAYGTSSV